MNNEEQAYLDLLQDVIYHGIDRDDRTVQGSRAGFFATLKFDLSKSFPLFTNRFTSFKISFYELMMFLNGECNSKYLEDKGINIWSGNTSREWLDNRGLAELPAGSMGKTYPWQIRNFGGTENQKGFDQLTYLVENIKSRPNDRKHLMCYWNPQQIFTESALEPCHLLYNCQVAGDKINAVFYMRSSDLLCGLNYNVSFYAILTHIIAKLTGYQVGTLAYVAADPHIYKSHIEGAMELIKRTPRPFPQIKFKKDFSSLDEALALTYDDVEIIGYEHCGKMKFEMAI